MQVSQPVRRNKRLNNETHSVDPSEADTASTAALIPESKKSRKLRHVIENPYKDEWLVNIGSKLFDIVSAGGSMRNRSKTVRNQRNISTLNFTRTS